MKINTSEIFKLKKGEIVMPLWYCLVTAGPIDNEAEYTSKNFTSEHNAKQHLNKMIKIFKKL